VLREIFFPPFAAAVKRGNVQSVMASYNEIDGVPSHANGWLLITSCAVKWGSGCGGERLLGISQLKDIHHVERTSRSRVRALAGGRRCGSPDGNVRESPAALMRARVAG